MKNLARILAQLFEEVLYQEAKRATKYVSPRETVKATYQGRRDKRLRSQTVVVTLGSPNYRERLFIKKAKRSGKLFPIDGLEVKHSKK
jgi:hypothetical protein